MFLTRSLRSWFGLSPGSRASVGPRRVSLQLESLEDRLTPTQLTVTSYLDPAAPTPGTLRYAVHEANLDAAKGLSDTITFAASLNESTIVLTRGPLELTVAAVPANGVGTETISTSNAISISGNHESGVFQVDAGVKAVISGIVIEAGNDTIGGGINNAGILTVTNCWLTGNTAGYGGGIYNAGSGSLTVENTHVNYNTASFGAGIANLGTAVLNIYNSYVDHDTAKWDGGGIYNTANATVANLVDSDVLGNNAARNGGGIDNGGTINNISDSSVNSNTAAYGGGICNLGTAALSIYNSDIDYDAAKWDGGGIYNTANAAVTNLVGSYVLHNNAARNGGGIDNGGTVNNMSGSAVDYNAAPYGGGICNLGIIHANGVSVYYNYGLTLGGGIYNSGLLSFTAGAVKDNTSWASGGGVANTGTMFLDNSPVAGNSAPYNANISSTGTLYNFSNPPDIVTTNINGQPTTILPTQWASLANVPLFAGGSPNSTGSGLINYTDVQQGEDGDCWLMASLAEVAARDSSAIRSMFTAYGDGIYTVRFYQPGGAATYITVDSSLPVNADGSLPFAQATTCLWVALVEKAYAEWQGSYQALNGGSAAAALHAITGQRTGTGSISTNSIVAWPSSDFIVLDTEDPSNSQIVPDHFYAWLGVDPRTGLNILYNPWGNDGTASYEGHPVYGATFECNSAFLLQNFIQDDYAYPGV